MDRILMGMAPANNDPRYSRSDIAGIFVSKTGSNVFSCPDGDLIFDSTTRGMLQVITEGRATIPVATNSITPGSLTINTGKTFTTDLDGDSVPAHVWWNAASSDFANTITNLSFLQIGKNLSIDGDGSKVRVPGYMLNCKTYSSEDDNTVIIQFDNASQEDEIKITYTVWREASSREE